MWWGTSPIPKVLPEVGPIWSPVIYIHECPICHVIHETKSVNEWCRDHRGAKGAA